MCSTVMPKPIKLTMRNNGGMNSLWNLLWNSIKMKGRQLSAMGTGESLRSCHETSLWPVHASPLEYSILKLEPQGDDIKRWCHREMTGSRGRSSHEREALFKLFFFFFNWQSLFPSSLSGTTRRYHVQSREKIFSDTESSGTLVLDFWVLSTGTIHFYWT